MLVSKSFMVTGDTRNRDGKNYRNICDNVNAILEKFHAENPGKFVGLESTLEYGGLSGVDIVFLVITVEVEEKETDKEIKKVSKKQQ